MRRLREKEVEEMEKVIWMICGSYTASMAWLDLRKKEIPVIPGIICAAVVVLLQLLGRNTWIEWLPGICTGLLLWGVSRLSRGAVGEGDALVFAVVGVSLGFMASLEVLMLSLFFAAAAGIALMAFRRVGRRYRMPFIPFTAAAYGILLCL